MFNIFYNSLLLFFLGYEIQFENLYLSFESVYHMTLLADKCDFQGTGNFMHKVASSLL